MKRVSFSDRLRYAFDNTMSRGTVALISWLFLASAAVIIAVSLIVAWPGIGPSGEGPLSPIDVAWMSLMLAQLSENPHLAAVFEDLFNPEGSELYLKPAGDYVETGRPVNFYTVVEAAARRRQAAVGYRVRAEVGDPGRAYGVHLNPAKSQRLTFAPEDRIIVLAQA